MARLRGADPGKQGIAGRTADARRVCTDEAQGGTRGDAGANRRSSQQNPLGPGANGVVAWREPAG